MISIMTKQNLLRDSTLSLLSIAKILFILSSLDDSKITLVIFLPDALYKMPLSHKQCNWITEDRTIWLDLRHTVVVVDVTIILVVVVAIAAIFVVVVAALINIAFVAVIVVPVVVAYIAVVILVVIVVIVVHIVDDDDVVVVVTYFLDSICPSTHRFLHRIQFQNSSSNLICCECCCCDRC